jgi:beta-phosphoglucomutase-like phosphatase (HAD superfamily)
VEAIQAVLFEPVGCLAEFAATDFDAAAVELFAAADAATEDSAVPGSRAYWRLMGLIEPRYDNLAAPLAARLEEREVAAVDRAELYEDVRPSLEKLRDAGTGAYLVSSLSRTAIARFLDRFSLAGLFAGVIAREDAEGVMARPLRHAVDRLALDPARIIYLVDHAVALELTKQQSINALLMINDYDEGRALAERSPAGGLVSLAELADALRLIEQRSGLRGTARMPHKPFELFEPG